LGKIGQITVQKLFGDVRRDGVHALAVESTEVWLRCLMTQADKRRSGFNSLGKQSALAGASSVFYDKTKGPPIRSQTEEASSKKCVSKNLLLIRFERGEAYPRIDGASKRDLLAVEQLPKASESEHRQPSGSWIAKSCKYCMVTSTK